MSTGSIKSGENYDCASLCILLTMGYLLAMYMELLGSSSTVIA